jgi:hypothetical protein
MCWVGFGVVLSEDPIRIIFTSHAEKRMLQRGIERSEVEEAIKNPSATMPGVRPKTVRIRKQMPDDRILQVVYKAKGKSTFLIITAVWGGR